MGDVVPFCRVVQCNVLIQMHSKDGGGVGEICDRLLGLGYRQKSRPTWTDHRCALCPETDLSVHVDHEILSRADKVYIYWCSHLLTIVS